MMTIFRPKSFFSPSSLSDSRRSFTLIEVVVTASLIILFMGALIALFNMTLKQITVNKHRLQAAQLAREGAELTRQIRDTAWLKGVGWASMNTDCWLKEGTGHIETNCSTLNRPGILAGSQTQTIENVSYTKSVNITTTGSTKKVNVVVSWQDFGQNYQVLMVLYLTDWRV